MIYFPLEKAHSFQGIFPSLFSVRFCFFVLLIKIYEGRQWKIIIMKCVHDYKNLKNKEEDIIMASAYLHYSLSLVSVRRIIKLFVVWVY